MFQRRHKEKNNDSDKVYTPSWLADVMVRWAALEPGMLVLEPCFGGGAIVDRVPDNCFVTGFEIEPGTDNTSLRRTLYHNIDFLTLSQTEMIKYDVALVNPPFSGLGAWKFAQRIVNTCLTPNGRCIIIMPSYIIDNSEWRKPWICDHTYKLALLPKDTFSPMCPTIHAYLCDIRPKKTGREFLDYIINPNHKTKLEAQYEFTHAN